jgi:diacylglycerol kinase (ATP)
MNGVRHLVVFNPASGRGRGLPRISSYRRLLEDRLDDVTFRATERAGHERVLTDAGLEEGFDVIVAVGGDGTWSNVADRIVASGRKDVVFGILPNGTGNDFGRNLGFHPRNAEEAVAVLATGHERAVDVGRVETPSASENSYDVYEPRHFLNVLGFGFDVAVIDTAARARWLKGEALYKGSALRELFRFPGVHARLARPGAAQAERRHLMVAVANGCYFGGGFPVAPGAEVDDGHLHICAIEDAGALRRLQLFARAGKGRHVGLDEVTLEQDRSLRLDFREVPRFALDGEVRRAESTHVELRILPKALRVIAPRA